MNSFVVDICGYLWMGVKHQINNNKMTSFNTLLAEFRDIVNTMDLDPHPQHLREISTQTDECVDVISNLNEEYDTLQNKYSELENRMFKKDRVMVDLLWDACESQGLRIRNPMSPVEDILEMFCKEMEIQKKECDELLDYVSDLEREDDWVGE